MQVRLPGCIFCLSPKNPEPLESGNISLTVKWPCTGAKVKKKKKKILRGFPNHTLNRDEIYSYHLVRDCRNGGIFILLGNVQFLTRKYP